MAGVQFDASGLEPFQFDNVAQRWASGPSVQEARLGVQGGNSQGRGIAAAEFMQPSMGPNTVLPDFVNKLMGDQIEAAKQDKFFQGFAEARAGKTVAEINRDTPWFAKLFGQTNYEAGASVYNAQAAVATMTQQMHENMDELKTKTPEEMGKWMSEKQREMQTGDVFADVALNKALVENSGPLLDAQAKAHFAWQQDNIVKSQLENGMAQARNYEASTRNAWQWGKDHPNEQPDAYQQQERERLMLDAFGIQEGQTLDSAVNFIGQWSEKAAREGLWHSIDLMQSTGLYQQLPTEAQEKIEKRMAIAQNKWLANMEGTDDAKEAYMIRAEGAAGVVSPNKLYENMSDFNKMWKAKYGIAVPYFDNKEMQSAVTGNAKLVFDAHQRLLDEDARAREKAQTKLEKEAAEARTDASYAQMAGKGELGIAMQLSNSDKKRADAALGAIIDRDPEAGLMAVRANFVNPRGRFVSDVLKSNMQNAVSAGAGLHINDAVRKAHQQWSAMFYSKGVGGIDDGVGPAMANEYMGQYADKMYAYDFMVKNGVDEDSAYQKTFGSEAEFGEGDLREGQGYKINNDALNAAVAQISPSAFMSWFGGNDPISPSSQKLIAHYASQDFGRMLKQSPHLDPKIIATQAVHNFVNGGGEIAGKYAWRNNRGQKGIAQTLGIPNDLFGDIFDDTLTNKLRKSGLKVDSGTNFEIIRHGGSNVRLTVIGYDTDGTSKAVQLEDKDFEQMKVESATRKKLGGFNTREEFDRAHPTRKIGGLTVPITTGTKL